MPAPRLTTCCPDGANVDGFDRVNATHFYLSFDGDVTISMPGPDLTVADEDVVFYNAGTWSLYFDGSANGSSAAAPTWMRSASSADYALLLHRQHRRAARRRRQR